MDVTKLLAGLGVSCLVATSAMGGPMAKDPDAFEYIRLGDKDGFGFNVLPKDVISSFTGATGHAADRNENGKLEPGDTLPDRCEEVNGKSYCVAKGMIAGFTGDDFDNRSDEQVTGENFEDVGSEGAQYTDISLSKSYSKSQKDGQVFNANEKKRDGFGEGGEFPAEHEEGKPPKKPGFEFEFTVEDSALEREIYAKPRDKEKTVRPIFFNLLFADYDVKPAHIDLTYREGTDKVQLVPQNRGPASPKGIDRLQYNDGLMQLASRELDFDKVFEKVNGKWSGYLKVDFIGGKEPYTAFDYVELSVNPVNIVPATPTLPLVALGLLLAGYARCPRRS